MPGVEKGTAMVTSDDPIDVSAGDLVVGPGERTSVGPAPSTIARDQSIVRGRDACLVIGRSTMEVSFGHDP
jgi:hypothetical protein